MTASETIPQADELASDEAHVHDSNGDRESAAGAASRRRKKLGKRERERLSKTNQDMLAMLVEMARFVMDSSARLNQMQNRLPPKVYQAARAAFEDAEKIVVSLSGVSTEYLTENSSIEVVIAQSALSASIAANVRDLAKENKLIPGVARRTVRKSMKGLTKALNDAILVLAAESSVRAQVENSAPDEEDEEPQK